MSLILAKSNYIIKANETYLNLKEYEKLFEKEALVISHIKCALLQEVAIEDYYAGNIYVSVHECADGYDLYFDGYMMHLEVVDKQIVDYVLSR